MDPGVFGAIVGTIIGMFMVMRMNAKLRATPCPKCGEVLGAKPAPKRTLRQTLLGGMSCPSCGCDVNGRGKARQVA